MKKNAKKVIESTVAQVANNYKEQSLFTSRDDIKHPRRDTIIHIIKDLRRVMFPGYFGDENINLSSPEYFVGEMLTNVYDNLYTQIKLAIGYSQKTDSENVANLDEQTEQICFLFFEKLSEIQRMLLTDIDALYEGDPAANSKEEIIFSYPGLFAIFVYRIAHELYLLGVPFIPRIMTEYAHSRTGIDINAGATIGEYFFIDHGTGIVIGETTVIGKHVKLYQGVTLGGLSTRGGQKLSGVKRHPTIEDNVTIYSGASILGGDTVIGRDSTIGGNTFIVESVPAGTRVSLKNPDLIFKNI